MTATIKVTKRSGKAEELDIEKIHQVVEWACEGITGVSISDIVLSAKLKFYNKIPTKEIHSALIDTAEELTTVDTPNYDKVASRLYGFDLRKRVFGSFESPEKFSKLVKNLIKKGLYTPELGDFPNAFIDRLWNRHVKQDAEYEIPCYGLKQLEKKYCVTSRTTGMVYETPSMVYFRAALVGAMQRNIKMEYMSEGYLSAVEKTFKTYFDQFSTDAENSLPSPIMNGVGTPLRQYSSCTGIDFGDSIPSINAASASVVTYVTQRAGIGANVGRIRAAGEDVRGGEVRHTGMVPFIKKIQGDVHCVSQGGYRKSAGTLFFPIWHYEFPELVVLKDNTMVDEVTARHLDYGVTINGYFYEKLLKGEDITLISPHHEDHRLYEAFAKSKEEFAEVYEEMIANPEYRTRTYPASEIFTQMFMMQRKETGRIYFVNIDHANAHGAFDPNKAPVHFSNLCLEILLPASPMNHFNDPDGEIFLCTLANINMGTVKIEDLKRVCYNTVRYLDDILDYQDYPTESARFWATKRRALGIGINNYAYWLARQGLKYGEQEALEKTHEYMEAMQYWLIDASVEVAKEKGRCDLFGDTKYSQGILPCDEGSYKADVDSLGEFELHMDWEALREKVKEHGMRNSTLSAIPPSETSSQVIKHGATNSLEQPRALITRRSNKDLSGKTLVPELARLKNKYDMLWEHASPEGYLLTVAVVQKWVDQSISANFSYNPRLWPNGDIPMSQMIRDLLMSYKYGVKTGYYHNTNKESGIEEEEDPTEEEGCEGGGCNV